MVLFTVTSRAFGIMDKNIFSYSKILLSLKEMLLTWHTNFNFILGITSGHSWHVILNKVVLQQKIRINQCNDFSTKDQFSSSFCTSKLKLNLHQKILLLIKVKSWLIFYALDLIELCILEIIKVEKSSPKEIK